MKEYDKEEEKERVWEGRHVVVFLNLTQRDLASLHMRVYIPVTIAILLLTDTTDN